jgi:hypothetical protein
LIVGRPFGCSQPAPRRYDACLVTRLLLGLYPDRYPALQCNFRCMPSDRFKIATHQPYDTGMWYHLEPMFEEKGNVEMDSSMPVRELPGIWEKSE